MSSEATLLEDWLSGEGKQLPLAIISIDEPSTSGSPRSSGHNFEHVRILAGVDGRLGWDGRYRPRDSASRREVVRKMLADNPDASLRAIARQMHVSPETVRSVRATLTGGRTGEISGTYPGADPAVMGKTPLQGLSSVDRLHLGGTIAWRALRADPAFRPPESGRFLLRMLSTYETLEAKSEEIIHQIPPHCIEWVVTGAQARVLKLGMTSKRAEQQASVSHQP